MALGAPTDSTSKFKNQMHDGNKNFPEALKIGVNSHGNNLLCHDVENAKYAFSKIVQ